MGCSEEVIMAKGNWLCVAIAALASMFSFVSIGFADAPKPDDVKKQTTLGLYVDAAESKSWVDEKKATVIDVRTPEEFLFVGHTGVAVNIPIKLWKGEFVQKDGKTEPKLIENVNFANGVQKKYKPEDTIILMCRSGQRSAEAADVLAKTGFKKVYSMVDGFEGDMAKEGQYNGKRTVNGWKNAGNPWTYSLKEEIVWSPAK
jgi:rhodanese-related sulfurtransferase